MNKFEKILDDMPDTPIRVFVTPKGIGFEYCFKGIGFGEVFLSLSDGKIVDESGVPTGRLHINSECMSKEFVKGLICKAVDESEFV